MRIKNSGHFLSAYSVYADKQLSAYTLHADKQLSAYTLYADKANLINIHFFSALKPLALYKAP